MQKQAEFILHVGVVGGHFGWGSRVRAEQGGIRWGRVQALDREGVVLLSVRSVLCYKITNVSQHSLCVQKIVILNLFIMLSIVKKNLMLQQTNYFLSIIKRSCLVLV